VLFGNVECREPQAGELLPQVAAPAFLRLQNFAARLERIMLPHEAPHGVGKELLFFGEIEIHD
jgi:hypothetical protein